jgi:O-acetyl-ADP-ribose deacetylase (regulator of RNase III)
MENINFILCDMNELMVNEWNTSINTHLSTVEKQRFRIINSKLEDIKFNFDCIVSPANSFGLMDGAYDLSISKMFCINSVDSVIHYVQSYIYKYYNGYQPTGTCCLINMSPFTNKHKCKWLAHVPTMVVPQNVRWNKDIAYNCMWSLLNELENKKKDVDIKTVFLTGFATGIGQIPTEVAANQMMLAYRHFIDNLHKTNKTTTWSKVRDVRLDVDETCRTMAMLR